jgi:DNA-directed RNA polymerase specialized sigma54-like protein
MAPEVSAGDSTTNASYAKEYIAQPKRLGHKELKRFLDVGASSSSTSKFDSEPVVVEWIRDRINKL